MRRPAADTRVFLDANAARMRLAPTKQEAQLLEAMTALGFKFQHPIQGRTKNGGAWQLIADFAHEGRRLIIEVDGGVHRRQRGKDRRRDTRAQVDGWRTLRFTNQQVKTDVDGVMREVEEALRG